MIVRGASEGGEHGSRKRDQVLGIGYQSRRSYLREDCDYIRGRETAVGVCAASLRSVRSSRPFMRIELGLRPGAFKYSIKRRRKNTGSTFPTECLYCGLYRAPGYATVLRCDQARFHMVTKPRLPNPLGFRHRWWRLAMVLSVKEG